jgi:molybdopterin synthase sulfur carrier subunit
MATVHFTSALKRFLSVPTAEVTGETIGAALDQVFRSSPRLRGYVLDDQGSLRVHVKIFVNGKPVEDPSKLSDRIGPTDEIHVIQALSGG